ncbi:ABC transporter ATP-binding protein, partial [Candidatus Saccharibacteria bacterium]|nr:ABC transporter ATP-binding protein [Candidatus Saccharibacteria bacterium]
MSQSKKQSVIQLKKLTKEFGNFRAVESVTLTVEKGTIFGFLGPNGAGKTTTISMMMGLLGTTEGEIKLFGRDNAQFDTQNRADIGYLAGDMALDGGLTGWQELEYFARIRGDFDKEYIAELAERLQCDLTRKIKKLSRGNRQKVGLIAALMHKPQLLILDEPTSGLDPLVQAEFNEIIHEHKKAGRTAFISSHVLSEVQQICDQVAFIKEGKLIINTPLKDLFKSAPKQIEVTPNGKLVVDFANLTGALRVSESAGVVRFTYSGNIGQLMKFLSTQPMKDLTITDADLETVFMN